MWKVYLKRDLQSSVIVFSVAMVKSAHYVPRSDAQLGIELQHLLQQAHKFLHLIPRLGLKAPEEGRRL